MTSKRHFIIIKMFKFKECQGLKLDYENLDKVLGSEDRTVNEYFGIYKLSLLVIGGSGAR